ncbi:hypothetical protein CENSYa_1516 [Cenarchaeum symbiosum A]|uniref:Uncharacterized protein n=1 Tax=Cenarchaeum symbiosum (strain A) TaxID=414004 RepID=A0RXS1_CENSY|nr:hypothetical protein CENSYa_1516 [Cenarchaeum symbiosum A]
MTGIITKRGGRPYSYFEYHENNKTVQVYCGPEGSVQARRKAIELEISLLEKRVNADRDRLEQLRKELDKLPKK